MSHHLAQLLPFSHTQSGQSKQKAKQAIQAILALDSSIKSEQAAIRDLYASFNAPFVDYAVADDALENARAHLKRLEKARATKFTALAVDEGEELLSLKSNKYLTARMNALALKHRLRDRLRQRKFEMERLESSYRRTMNGTLKYVSSTINHSRMCRDQVCETHPGSCCTKGSYNPEHR